jgi:hypothetical protein
VEGGRAGPLAFQYGPDGLAVNGGGVPLPAGDALSVLNQALAPAGLSIKVVGGDEIAGGRTSDVVLITGQIQLPSGQTGMLHLRIGGTGTAVGGISPGGDLGSGDGPAILAPLPPAEAGPAGVVVGDRPAAMIPLTEAPVAAPPSTAPSEFRGEASFPPVEPGAPVLAATGSTEELATAPIGVAAQRFAAVRVAYGGLAAGVAVLLAAAWWWRRTGVLEP